MDSQKNKLIVVGVLFLVVLGVLVFKNTSPGDNGSIVHMSTGDRKEEVLRRVDDGKVVTEEDKQVLIEVLHGEKFKEYNFTPEEQQRILNALNK